MNKFIQDAERTFHIYKQSSIIEKYVRIKPSEKNYQGISERLDKSINEYFYIPN